MSDIKIGKIKIETKFPTLDDLFERSDKLYLEDFEKYMLKTGTFDLIKGDFKKMDLKEIDLTKIERQKKRGYRSLLKQWEPVLKDVSNIEKGLPVEYQWLDFEDQVEYVRTQFQNHQKVFARKKANTRSLWGSFIDRLRRIYKTEITDHHHKEHKLDSYFIHVPKVEGSRCECTDSASSEQTDSFAIEFIGLGGGGVTEISQEESLVTTIEDGKCCKIEITVKLEIKEYNLYRFGKIVKQGAYAKPVKIIAIAPVTIDAEDDTCGWTTQKLNQKKCKVEPKMDMRRLKNGFSKKILKLSKRLQTKGGVSFPIPALGITAELNFTFRNTSEKQFIYTLPKGRVYTYYTIPNTLGYSWSVK